MTQNMTGSLSASLEQTSELFGLFRSRGVPPADALAAASRLAAAERIVSALVTDVGADSVGDVLDRIHDEVRGR